MRVQFRDRQHHVFDEAWSRGGRGMGMLVRYCDDFLVLAPTRVGAEAAKTRIEVILEPLGLRLYPDKTRITCLRRGQEGFVFLGFERLHHDHGVATFD